MQHDKCGQKVTTDSLLLGSWCHIENVHHALDIGTGSGLLALMLAQRIENYAMVDAIDIDAAAVAQAKENVSNSPWPEKIKVIQASLQNYHPEQLFELIVCNPPYFPQRHYKNSDHYQPDKQRRQAREQDSLSFFTLCQRVSELIAGKGRFATIIPISGESDMLNALQKNSLSIHRLLRVRPTASQTPKLLLIESGPSTSVAEVLEKELVIRHSDNTYTQEYQTLCRDFYLNFPGAGK
ncbi:MAG: tRNA1(Val) (adenine(37)-N6)-methyltransferase [Aestuariibacter sp.]